MKSVSFCFLLGISIFLTACAGTGSGVSGNREVFSSPKKRLPVTVVIPRLSEEETQKILEKERVSK